MKENLRFNFQPFEIDSEFDRKPQAFTKAFWQGKECEFALVLVDGYLRFCEVDKLELGEWNFAISKSAAPTSKDAEVDVEFLESAFHSALEKGEFGRLLCVAPSDSLEYRTKATQFIFIGAENKGFIQSKAQPNVCQMSTPPSVRSPFYAFTSLTVAENPILQWYAETQKWLADEESDFSFSYRWNQLYDFEKSNLVTVFKNGNETERDEIARLILSLGESPFARPEASFPMYGLHFKMSTSRAPAQLKSICAIYDWSKLSIDQQRIRYGLWNVFIKHFEPRLNPELRAKYTVLEGFDDYFWYGKVKTDNAVFTAHERLEVRLKLAEWLPGKVPDEQIATLISGSTPLSAEL